MRKEYIISGFVTLIWFVGLLVFLWITAIDSYVVPFWSVLGLAILLFALGLLLPEKR